MTKSSITWRLKFVADEGAAMEAFPAGKSSHVAFNGSTSMNREQWEGFVEKVNELFDFVEEESEATE